MVIEKLQYEDIQIAASLIADSFTLNEPMTSYLKINSLSFKIWCEKIINTSIHDDICFVAKENDKIVGCVIAENIQNTIIPNSKDIQPIIDLLHELECFYPNSKNKTCHIYLVATRIGYERKNICHNLLNHLHTELEKQNYKHVIAELTSPGTQHICLNKLNFEILYCLDYKTHYAFQNLDGKCILAMKNL